MNLHIAFPDPRWKSRSCCRYGARKNGSRLLGLLTLCLAVVPLWPLAAADEEDDPLSVCRGGLEAYGIKPTAEGVIAHLVGITPTAAGLKDVDALVRQLGAATFAERNQAQRQLAALGILADARVREAAKSGDPEVKSRAEAILKQWSSSSADTAMSACFRALAVMKPAKAVPSILGVLPLCGKVYLSVNAEEALQALAVTNDLPALKRVLDTGGTQERCIVVAVYGRLLGAERAAELDPLLAAKAPPQLRLATARALANLGLFRAAGVFVDLLEHDDIEIRSASFNCLLQFTKQDFQYSAYGPEDKRRAAVAAWQQWLAGDGKTAKLNFPLKIWGSASYLVPGHTLIAMGNNQRGAVEFDADGKEIWSYPFQNCWTAERLANGNTLLASHSAGIVEVSPDKKVVWEYNGNWIKAFPLDNGNVLTVSQNVGKTVEIRKQDKSVVWEFSGNGSPVSAIRLPNGNTILGANGGGLFEVTPEKKIVWTYRPVQNPYGLQMLPNGNLLVADYGSPKGVFELDRKTDRKVWECDININGPVDAFRTTDGNTLITNGEGVIEVTPEKKIIRRWSGNNYGAARR